jgi:hypothetical protein
MSLDIVDRRDVKTHAESTFTPDGTPSRVVGSLDVDIISMTMPDDRVFVMGAGMAGNPSNTRVFVVSQDGKRMSETIASHGQGNVPVTRINRWVRK